MRMVGVVLRNLLRGPVTRHYPDERRTFFTGSRGRLVFAPERCEFCGECERICPARAIELDTAWDTSREDYAIIWLRRYYSFRCIACGSCVEACPYGALHLETEPEAPAYRKRVSVEEIPNWHWSEWVAS
ncbi:4Fe-4S dicluster domain-containing protein [Desulfothermobacter acidiphilus]|uniref:4Fe-4S dicluster domain-containing protein n=1 Tax=Desulfothermobacter acidiphilus TaxID=1938353 RepID=UPI003F8CEFD4